MHTLKQVCCGCALSEGTVGLSTIWMVLNAIGLFYNISCPKVRLEFLYLSIIVLISCSAGLYGALKRKPNYIIPFMIMQFFGVIASIMLFILILAFEKQLFNALADYIPGEIMQQVESVHFFLLPIVILICGWFHYSFVIVYSHYDVLRRKETENQCADCILP